MECLLLWWSEKNDEAPGKSKTKRNTTVPTFAASPFPGSDLALAFISWVKVCQPGFVGERGQGRCDDSLAQKLKTEVIELNLWSFSCFSFEEGHGELRLLMTGPAWGQWLPRLNYTDSVPNEDWTGNFSSIGQVRFGWLSGYDCR